MSRKEIRSETVKLIIILVVGLFLVPISPAQTLDNLTALAQDSLPESVPEPAPVSTITMTKTPAGTTFHIEPAGYWDCTTAIGPNGGSATCNPAHRESALCLNTWVEAWTYGGVNPAGYGRSQCGSVDARCGNLIDIRTKDRLEPFWPVSTNQATLVDEVLQLVNDVITMAPPPWSSYCYDSDTEVDLDDFTPWRCTLSWSSDVVTAQGTCGLGDP